MRFNNKQCDYWATDENQSPEPRAPGRGSLTDQNSKSEKKKKHIKKQHSPNNSSKKYDVLDYDDVQETTRDLNGSLKKPSSSSGQGLPSSSVVATPSLLLPIPNAINTETASKEKVLPTLSLDPVSPSTELSPCPPYSTLTPSPSKSPSRSPSKSRFEDAVEVQTKTELEVKRLERKEKCVHCCKSFVAFLFSTIGLTCIMVGYAILGGFIFMKLESPNEKIVKTDVQQTRRSHVDRLWFLTEEMNVFHRENWTIVANEILDNYTKAIYKATKFYGWDGKDGESEVQWTFAGALLYSITVITTIGK